MIFFFHQYCERRSKINWFPCLIFLFRQGRLTLLLLLDLGNGVNNTGNKAKENSSDRLESDGGVKEDKAGNCYGELIQRANHGVSSGGGNTNTPARGVGDTKRKKTRNNHQGKDSVSRVNREVSKNVLSGPVFKDDGSEKKDRDRQQVVVEHGVEIAELGLLNTLAHAEDETGIGKTVSSHPEVADVEASISSGLTKLSGSRLGNRDIGPSSDDRRKNNKEERKEGHGADRTAKPDNLTVGNENDGNILEDGEDRNRKELHGLGSGVNHQDQKNRNWQPSLGLSIVEITEADHTGSLKTLNDEQAHKGL